MNQSISLRGVRTHNLKAIDVEIPRGQLTVIVGVSGSGKSSLAFDTLYSEGQHRYIETFSPWARQFLDRLPRPQVDRIDGLPPAIALRQNIGSGGPRATIATRTEINDLLRTLFARFGQLICPMCRQVVAPVSPDAVLRRLHGNGAGDAAVPDGTRLQVGFPLAADSSQDATQLARTLTESGVTRVALGGVTKRLSELSAADHAELQHATAILDRLTWKRDEPGRILEGLEQCFALGDGGAVLLLDGDESDSSGTQSVVLDGRSWQQLTVRNDWNCPGCGWQGAQPTPELLSFRSAAGACAECTGVGGDCSACGGSRLNETARNVLLEGVSLADLHRQSIADFASWLSRQRTSGERTHFVQVASDGSVQASNDPAREAAELQYSVTMLLQQLQRRVDLLRSLGLDYLSLNREIRTLSGGESQRVALAVVLSSGLVNSLFVLDEPTSGLHPSDTHRVIRAVRQLTDSGNTVVVVEHDTQLIAAADRVIEIGPGAGGDGGSVVFSGSVDQLRSDRTAKTSRWLADTSAPAAPSAKQQVGQHGWMTLQGVECNNIKDAAVRFPLGCLSVVTGVSGSGKSSLAVQSLYPAMCDALQIPHRIEHPGRVRSLTADVLPDRVLLLDRRQLPRSTRSVPATLLGVFDDIRKVFAATHEARKRDFKPGMFSFNSARGGRCSACDGIGFITVDMQFLSDVEVTCEVCEGRRFQNSVLDVRYRDRSIAEVLDMPADDAFQFFHAERAIQKRLVPLRQAGLGYLRIGQPASTLSGGESQRLRIAACLAGIPLPEELSATNDAEPRGTAKSTLFILDEPTSGLHPNDVEGLLTCLRHLTEVGHTVIVIEHDLQLVASADYEVRMGPGAGPEGGRVLTEADIPG